MLDATEFVHDQLLPRLELAPLDERVFVHPNCAARKLGVDQTLLDIAAQCAAHAEVPSALACCATAGDRGLLFPELSRNALRAESAELAHGSFDRCVSSNATCEARLSRVTDRPFRSYLYLVEDARQRRINGA